MRRKLVITVIALLGIAVLAVATLPWWFGAALAVAGGRFGLSFGEYERVGYGRFALNDVVVERTGVRVEASRVEAPTPLRWIWGEREFVTVGTWRVLAGEGPKRAEKPGSGWRVLQARIEQVMTALVEHLPEASAGAGEVIWRRGRFGLEKATWSGGRLRVEGLAWKGQVADEVSVWREETGQLKARLALNAEEAVAEAAAEDGRIVATGTWWGQRWEAEAQFADIGWKLESARLEADAWAVPAARLGLAEFYDAVEGSARVTWGGGLFNVEARAEGRPKAQMEVPALKVDVRADGDWEAVRVEALALRAPGMEARLSEPVVLGTDGVLKSGKSRFTVRANLGELPWTQATGELRGTVDVTPRKGATPVMNARLESEAVAWGEWRANEVRLRGFLAWPRAEVEVLRVQLAEGDEVELAGAGDVRARSVESLELKGRVRHETVARWWPNVEFGEAEFSGSVSGTWPALVHKGRARVGAWRVKPMKPAELNATWTGEAVELKRVEVTVATKDGARILASGGVGKTEAKVERLEIWRTAEEALKSVAPLSVSWRPTLTVAGLRLEGGERLLAGELVWADAGKARMDVREIGREWLDAFMETGGPEWRVSSLKAEATWNGGPMTFEVAGGGSTRVGAERRAELALAMRGDARGVRVDTLLGAMDGRSVMSAKGVLPVVVQPRGAPWWRIEEDGELALEAETVPNAFFWEQIGALTGLTLADPELKVALSGTARAPLGEAVARVKRVTFANVATGKGEVPEVTDVEAQVVADKDGLALRELTLRVADQAVRAEGRIPAAKVRALLSRPVKVLAEAGEGRVEMREASVAALSRYAPAYLAPVGTLQLELVVKPGAKLGGFLQLKDAATRPLGPLGTLQSLGAEVVFDGRRVELKRVGATTGGRPVTLTGTVELPKVGEPRLDVALKGEGLPFVRQAGLLVRGDVDLRVVTGDDAVTRITGVTQLRDSLFLMDVRALLPSGGPRGAPGKRPPYFAVTTPPVEAWALDVEVKGDRFLRLRTPVFNGVVSADFRLLGTLGDPRAIGQATIDQGQVLFPFANFTVLQGGVRLTESNPFEPAVSLIGTSRRYGYLLRMELAGTADQPRLTFSSTPPLESEQVLLMVMAGETPHKEVTYTGRERATRLGAYLGQSLLGQLGADPSESERLSINVGERISEQGRETYGIEYELTPRWSLVGEYDEFDAYNLGVKWRVWSEKPKDVRGKEAADEGAK